MKISLLHIQYLAISLILLGGCGQHNSRRGIYPLESTPLRTCDRDNIHVSLRTLTPQRILEIFGADLTYSNTTVFQLSIDNRSTRELVLRPSYVSIPLLPRRSILQILSISSEVQLLSVAALGAVSLLFWWPGLFATVPLGIGMVNRKHHLTELLNRTVLDDQTPTIIIMPHERLEKYFFCDSRGMATTPVVRLFDRDSKQLISFPDVG